MISRILGFAVCAIAFYGIAFAILTALGPAYQRSWRLLDILAWYGTIAFASGIWLSQTLFHRIVRSYWKAQGYSAEASQRKLEELEEHAREGTWIRHGGKE